MSDDRVREIREMLKELDDARSDYHRAMLAVASDPASAEPGVLRYPDERRVAARIAVVQNHESDLRFLVAELDRARAVVEAARAAIEYRYAPMVSRIVRQDAMEEAVREYDAARSPDQAGGTTVADADEG